MLSVFRCSIFSLATFVLLSWAGQAAAQCSADTSYGDASITNPQVLADVPSSILTVSGDLNVDVDALVLEMYDGFGVFGLGILPGVYALSGANYSTCGLCVRLLTEAGDDGYLATGGTVEITQVDPELIVDILSLTLEHVVIDPGTFVSSPHSDACTSAVDSATIDTSPVAPAVPALGTGGTALITGALLAVGIRRLHSCTGSLA